MVSPNLILQVYLEVPEYQLFLTLNRRGLEGQVCRTFSISKIWEPIMMDTQSIKTIIKQSISRVTGIPAETISDSASYEGDLGLDSLSILEIAVDVENHFKFQASDDELTSIRTVEETVDLVRRRLCAEVA